MTKVIKFIELILTNFAGIKSLTVNYSTVNHIKGKNGEGKTTIGTAPIWTLWGKDLFGKDYTKDKYSPRPTNYKYDIVQASLLLSVNDTEYKFTREIAGKTNKFYINDIPKSATEFSAAVDSLFTQDEFMALYFPSYYFSLHWEKQRSMLMSSMLAPASKTVLTEMSRTSPDQKAKDIELNPMSAMLAAELKKHSMNDLEAKARDAKPRLDKQIIEAARDVETLSNQAEKLTGITGTREELEQARNEHDQAIVELEQVIAKGQQANVAYQNAEHRYNIAHKTVEDSKAKFPALKNEVIEDMCGRCKQPLQEESVKAVEADKERRIEEYKAKHALLVQEKKDALAALQSLEYVDLQEYRSHQFIHQQKLKEIDEQLALLSVKESIEQDIEAAKQREHEVTSKLRETVFLLEAIKAYKAKEAEVQAAELQSKFKTLSVRLFKYVKSSDSYDPDFSIQMNGKDYQYLSTGEKIGAGLELIEVLFKQTNMITPTFIDGIGEYTGKLTAYDQVITARAVENTKLTIEVTE
ncbi:ATPase [Paenibacillus camelliae]|uniref:ATPase n=1 Tax=Paenibacillus camelliae TaxID=512410 RepID=UPI00204056E7|nr:ATPase [Paenibacillus camelliae]MCM3632898.1 ATPase [Paenibacillus camelliae]